MKKKAFTLVELLAVIIILAIITLVAIPIVIDIISNSKNKSEMELIKLYKDTIEKRIANSNLDVSYSPDMCVIQSTGDLICLKNDEELYVNVEKTNKILEIKMDGKKPSEGSIFISNGKITEGENILYNGLYYKIIDGVVTKGEETKTDLIIGVINRIKTSLGNISGTCEIQNTKTMKCGSEVKSIEQIGHKVTEGRLVFEDGELKSYRNVKMEGKYYHNDLSGKRSETNEYQYLCTIVSDADNSGTITKGDKYTCKVKSDMATPYTFYVLTDSADGEVNLIMDKNICGDGSLVYTSANNYCMYNWNSVVSNNSCGPVTAMTYLYNGTKNWDNVDDMIMNYTDENNQNSTDYGYTSIVTNTTTKETIITGKQTTNTSIIGTSEKPLKTRLPKYDEIYGNGCRGNSGSCPVWLVENIKYYNVTNDKYSMNNNDATYQNINGYWLLSSIPNDPHKAFYVHFAGVISTEYAFRSVGIRPVITVNLNDLSS